MAATLKDVAQLAEVSVKTVSNVINHYPHVSDTTRHRVQDAIARLDYRPNLAARRLRTGCRYGLLGLVVPRIDGSSLHGLPSEIIRTAARQGFRVVVDQIEPDPERPSRSVRAGTDLPVDGVLVSLDVVPAELVDAQALAGTPVVLLGDGRDPRCDRIAVDGVQVAQDATEHLLDTGCRRIAAIGAHPDDLPGGQGPLTVGYQRALRRAGLDAPTEYLRVAEHHRRSDGYQAARSLFRHNPRPDGLFCYSDLLAIGAIRAVVDAGLRVPEDVAVIGIGGSEEGRYSLPPLTTVAADPAFVAREAISRIMTRITRPEVGPVQVTAPHAVTPRKSTVPSAGRA